jgi:CheY-like chemotaxis protein
MHLRRVAASVIIKEANSPERLLAETALFLHRVEASLPQSKRRMLEQLKRRDPVLSGRKVLIVDDDVRNIFALTSSLESYNMSVLHAENGQEGIKLLKATPGIEAVLMDIMMPEMDGYEAISAIRQMEEFRQLPIIALTAKAMKTDRDHCLEVGASDYISKPLDIDQLLSLLRVWLSRRDEDYE